MASPYAVTKRTISLGCRRLRHAKGEVTYRLRNKRR
jgi:hypothetical protein